jgi:gamma-glutamylcyclotransferase (GGCT)/AIG2-like uncharacterized protein YtfP
MSALLFFYGTLKRGCSNHRLLAGQTYLGPARTQPGFRLYDLGGYPGIAACTGDRLGVAGEVWKIEPATLTALDEFEGVRHGLYRREVLPLQAPFAEVRVEAYVPASLSHELREIGDVWVE